MEDLSYLNSEYARSKSIEQYNNDTKKEEKKMKRQFFIAGVQFRPAAEIAEAKKTLQVGSTMVLEPEPTNKFDPNAVKIIYKMEDEGGNVMPLFLGYVPKKFSSEVSAMLGIGAPIQCTVDEVNPAAKTYEMFKVTVAIPVDEEVADYTEFEEEQ